jgi:hypothetical protein
LSSVLCRLIAISSFAALVGGCGYGEVVHSWFDHSAGSEAPTSQKLPGHVYLVRGIAGDVFSLGMDQLADKITRRGVTATVHGLSEYLALAAEIVRKYKADEERGPIMLIGHSSGGDIIIDLAEKLKAANIPVALAFGFDPTRISDDVPSNVELFINLYQRYSPMGGGEGTAGAGFHGRLINVDLREHTEIVHINFDKTPQLQDLVVAKIIALATYVARQGRTPGAKQQERGAGLRPLVLKYVVPRDAPIELWDSAIEVKARSGDTLDSIAAAYNAPGWAIAQINGIGPNRPIESGRKLIIPRSLYTDAAVPLPEPRTVPHNPFRPAARAIAARPAPPNQPPGQKPAAKGPAATSDSTVPNSNSFSDRFESVQ